MRRSVIWCCSAGVPYGERSGYRPAARPTGLVMPVEIGIRDKPDLTTPPGYADYMDDLLASDRTPVKLGTVPVERTVGECYRYCLDVCKQQGLLSCRDIDGFRPHNGAKLLKDVEEGQEDVGAESKGSDEVSGDRGEPTDLLYEPKSEAANRGEMVNEKIYHLWDLLETIPLPSPVYGALSTKGRGLLQHTLLTDIHKAYPRLRSHYSRGMVSNLTGMLPLTEVATRIGLTGFCGANTDVSLWRERNYFEVRRHDIYRLLADHKKRVAEGRLENQRLSKYKRQAWRLSQYMYNLPGDIDELLPRVTWVSNHVLAFIAFVEIGEGKATAQSLIRRLFTGSFSHPQPEDLGKHPLDIYADKIATFKASSGFDFTSESNFDEFVKKHEIPREYTAVVEEPKSSAGGETGGKEAEASSKKKEVHKFKVPAFLTLNVQPTNALKEAQLILKYSPDVPEQVRNAPLDFEKDYDFIDDHDTLREDEKQMTELPHRDAKRALKGKLIAGKSVIGRGVGEDLAHCMNNAAKHMCMTYYFQCPKKAAVPRRATSSDSSSNDGEYSAEEDVETSPGATVHEER